MLNNETDEERRAKYEKILATCEERGMEFAKNFISRNKGGGTEVVLVRNWLSEKLKAASDLEEKRLIESVELAKRNVIAAESSADAAKLAVDEAAKANLLASQALNHADKANELATISNGLASEANSQSAWARSESKTANKIAICAAIIALVSVITQFYTN
ncbi:MAG: hypothetical protein CTY33_10115 [Methylotenera sp.]|nr:MAG: hypothetical protein CTY33_10115 [Methylotenera sp.]